MHPTVLTLNLSSFGRAVRLTVTLTDTCTGLGIPGATITFTGTGSFSDVAPAVTDASGTFNTTFNLHSSGTVRAHFGGQGIFGPSNSQTQTR
jgi:hypothetical protein